MDTFQMNQDLVSEKSWSGLSLEERKKTALSDHQKSYFEESILRSPYLTDYSFSQVQKKDLLVTSGEESVLRFSEEGAETSNFTYAMYFSFSEKINAEAFKNETASTFEGVGIAKEDTFRFLTLGKIARSVNWGVSEQNMIYRLLEKIEVFYKLSSRGSLSKESLIGRSKELLEVIRIIIPHLYKNERVISAELFNEMIDTILSIEKSVKSVYSQIEKLDKRYAALKKTIDSLGEEELQDSRLLLLRCQEVIEDIDILLTEKNEQGEPILSTEQKEYLTNSRARIHKIFEQTVVTDDWATKDPEMRQFQRGFFFVCESVECEDPEQLGTLRLKKMKDFVASMVNKWAPHDSEIPESWLMSHTKSIVENLKKQIIGDGNISKLIVYLFPMIAFDCYRVDPMSQAEELKKAKDYDLTGVMPAFFKGLDKTMEDVVNWAWNMKADSLESFELTGSDLHDMGLGVCKVEFKKQGVSKRFVIKPDDRQFEQIVLGNEGFAAEFNKSVKEGKVALIDDSGALHIRRDVLYREKEIDAVRTFDMQSSKSKKHGVLIEQLEIAQISNSSGGVGKVIDGEVNSQGRLFAQLICGIFGIGDLHERNVGYWEIYLKKIFYPALADSECGMELSLLGSFAEASAQSGFYDVNEKKYVIDEKWKLSIDEPLFIKLIHCINVLFDETNPIRCRRVPIGTDEQEGLRARFLNYSFSEAKRVVKSYLDRRKETALDSRKVESGNKIEEFVEAFEKSWSIYIGNINHNSRLLEFYAEFNSPLNRRFDTPSDCPIFRSTDQQFEAALNCAIEDYHEGKIPFYEMNPVTGELTTRGGAVVGIFMPDLFDSARIRMMKKMMLSNICVGEEKAWNYYQTTPSLSYII